MDCTTPSVKLLVTLGSIAVHAEEMISGKGHEYDIAAIRTLLANPELQDWLAQMGKLALLPVKRG